MKKLRVLALVIAVLSLVSLLFLVSCNNDSGSDSGKCTETGNHKWSKWTPNNDATCTTDGTKSRKCTMCKTEEKEADPGTASGHYFVESTYELNDDATCTTDGTETATCALCREVTDTRPAVDSALGHRYGNVPVESYNGYNVFVCLRTGCGNQTTVDNGTIDEDFEHCVDDVFEDNSKRYATASDDIIKEIIAYEGGEGKYLMLKRSADKIIGNTAFGLYLTPDYSIYKAKDYVVSYDLLITETTGDLILLEGKKANTEQVFATYDAETGKIMVNGTVACTVTPGEWMNLAFVLDDANAEFDVYVNNSLVISKAIYDKKDVYYMASDVEYFSIRMVAAARTASEFGIDNIKTYVGKTVTNPGEPMVKENITSTVSVPHNILGAITSEKFDQLKTEMKVEDAAFNKSYGYAQVDKDGVMVDTIVWQNYKSGVNKFQFTTFDGLDSRIITEADAAEFPNSKFDGGLSYKIYDLSDYESFTITFYCDLTSEELAEMGREGYRMCVAFECPTAKSDGKGSYWGAYVTFTAEDILNGEDGWQTITVNKSEFASNRNANWSAITGFTINSNGWANALVGVGLADNSNNNKNAVDGTVIKVESITLNNDTKVSHVKPAENCEHEYGETRVVPSTCTEIGYTVNVCTKCGGEEVATTGFTAPLGHKYETLMNVPATCTENGYYSEKCANCGDKHRTEYIANGHIEINSGLTEGDEGYDATYAPVVTAPTCYSTGITVRTCGVCGETWETDPTAILDHTWGEGFYATEDDAPYCTESGTLTYVCIHNGENGCDGMKTETVDALGHIIVPTGEEAVPPTCTTVGYTPATCERCQVKNLKLDEVPAFGHTWGDIESDINKAPTCFADGVQVQQCSVCEETRDVKVTERPEHSWDWEHGTETKAPTCLEEGEMSYSCLNEGCTETATEAIPTSNHVEVNTGLTEGDEGYDAEYAPVVTPATCLTDGFTTRKCAVCEQTYTTDTVKAVGSHNDGGAEHNVQIADCIQDGWDKYTCTVCNEEVFVSQTPSKGGHNYDVILSEEDKALVKKCTNCGDKVEAYVDTAPSYTDMVKDLQDKKLIYTFMEINSAVGSVTDGTGSDTQVLFGDVIDSKAGTGAYTQFVVRATKVTVKDNGGVDGVYKYAEVQNKTTQNTKHAYVNAFTYDEIPMGGDVVFEFALRLGTPGADGFYPNADFQLIDRSSKVTTGNPSYMPAFATFTKDGQLVSKVDSTKIIATFTQDKFTTVSIAMHLSTNTMDIYVDGILVAMGWQFASITEGYDCTKLQADEIRFLQHGNNSAVGLGSSWDVANVAIYGGKLPYAVLGADYCAIMGTTHEVDTELDVVTPPTCTADGYTTHTCANCGGTWVDTIVPKLEHAEPEIGEEYAPMVVAPTCTDGGYTKHSCATCDYTWLTDELPALGHTEVEVGEEYAGGTVVDPTCFANGYTERLCSRCGEKYQTDETEKIEHVMGTEPVDTTAPTCTEAGKNIYQCTNTGCEHTTEEEIPATGHNGEVVRVIAPGCSEGGYTIYKCTTCGIGYKGDETPANGHDFDNGTSTTTDPTCTDKGKTVTKCANCIMTQTVEINALGHSWQLTDEVAATCYADGSKSYICDRCQETKTDAVTDRPAHNYGDYSVETNPTCTDPGKEVRYCQVEECGASSDKVIPALGHALDEGVVTTAPDCENNGVRLFTCTRECGHTEEAAEPALGHIMVADGDANLDCDYAGFVTTICSRGCGHTDSYEKTATEHKFVPDGGATREWITVTPATCYSEGIRTSKCLNPGCTKDSYAVNPSDRTNVIAKTEHAMSEDITIPATASAPGRVYQECTNEGCDHEVTIEELPALSDLEFELMFDGSGYIVVGYKGEGGVLTIPATYNGLPVVDVDPSLFAYDAAGITAVIIEADPTNWSYGVFAGCTLEYVYISADITYIPGGIFEMTYIDNIYYGGAEGNLVFEDIDWGYCINDGTFTYDDIVYDAAIPSDEE